MSKDIYFLMFSIHGLVRYENMELGRDADTGGQVKYVVELAEALSREAGVKRVDLFTRLISDKQVSDDYSVPVEIISDKFRIVRIQCGGKKYIRKELLWPYLDEYIDKTIKFIKRDGVSPDIIHGHYADAGYVGSELANFFGTPFIFTGHSLGRPKKQKLIAEGMKDDEIEKKYHIGHRISVEEEIIKNADMIITSTNQEVKKQYGLYANADLVQYSVIPPGVSLEKFYPYYHDMMAEFTKDEESLLAKASVMEELNRFLSYPEKPVVLSLCRADKRKNISGLIDAYGKDKELQAMANLAVFAGIRKDISSMPDNEQNVLTEMLLLMDKYDLYGKMAIPKKHDFTYEVPELYRITAERRGVFVNAALTEPFGITLIEASSCGLPFVATNDGGPDDIVKNCKNGILVDPMNPEAISSAIKQLVVDQEKWKEFSANGIIGVNEHYQWSVHVKKYIEKIGPFLEKRRKPVHKKYSDNPIGDRLTRLKHFIITDIDDTLIGDDESLNEFVDLIRRNRDNVGFGIATGRTVDSAVQILDEHGVDTPDIIISSVGSEMYYQKPGFPDKGWRTHISKRWDRKGIKSLLDQFDFLTYQEEETQREFKISYYMDDEKDRIAAIHEVLLNHKHHYSLIYSSGRYLDILPYRASKGKAVRYIGYKWDISYNDIFVCGDSGNDREMLEGGPLGIVVSNYTPELESLKGRKRIYFSKTAYAAGIIEGLGKYEFI